jgi:hypothetical protein
MAKFHHACDLLFSKNEHLHDHMTINKVPNSFCCFHTTTSSSLTPTAPHCPLPLPPSSNIIDHHVIAQVCYQPCRATSLAPLMPLPSLKDVGVLTPPRCPRHNNATISTITMTMTASCYRPPPPVKCHVSKKEGTRRREWGSKIPTAALAMPIAYALLQAHLQRQHPSAEQCDPYHCPCCTHPSQKFLMVMYQQWGGVIIHMPPLPLY